MSDEREIKLRDMRRMRRYMISSRDVILVLENKIRLASACLPDDFQVLSVGLDLERNQLSCILWSSQWEIVPDGEIIPYASDPWLQMREVVHD